MNSVWILQEHPYDGGGIRHIFRSKEEADLYASVFGPQGEDLQELSFSDDLITKLKNKEIWFYVGLNLNDGELISAFPSDDRWNNHRGKDRTYRLNEITEPSHKDCGNYYIYVHCISDSKESAIRIAEEIRLKHLEKNNVSR